MKKIVLLILLFLAPFSHAARLQLDGKKAWLSAENTPLPKLLHLFEQRGVEVLMDPSISPEKVSGSWANVEINRLIDQLVGSNDYLLEWKKTTGPLGDLFQLASIRIYAHGNMSAAQPLSKGRILDIVTTTNGVSYLRGEIMVAFQDGATSEDLQELLKKLGGTVIEVIDPPGIYRIKLNEDMSVEKAIEIAKQQESVIGTEPNYAYERTEKDPVPLDGFSNALNLHLPPGETAVAVFDSGIDPQYANLPFIRGTYNALDPSQPMSDPLGHGTLTAMIAAGAITPLGATPAETGVPVFAVRTFDENGYTSSDILMRALRYAAENGARIVSMSWGSEVDSDFMRKILSYANQSGLTLYASAGNKPTGEPIFPAAYDSVIAVGGLAPDGSEWDQSNYGDFVEDYEPAFAQFAGKIYRGTSISCPLAASKEARK
jgi:hypothetical protein